MPPTYYNFDLGSRTLLRQPSNGSNLGSRYTADEEQKRRR